MNCAEKTARTEGVAPADPADEGEIHFQEAEPGNSGPLTFGVSVQPPASPESGPRSRSAGDGVSIEDLSNRIDEMLEHLEGITRTMNLVRWVMWGLGVATVLSVVVTVGGLLYSMSMIGSLTDLLGQPVGGLATDELPAEGGRAGDDGVRNAQIPPQLREKLKPIEDYSNTVNELLNEVNH